jgi:hypothetical protein
MDVCAYCAQAISKEAMMRRCGGGAWPKGNGYDGAVRIPPVTVTAASVASTPSGSHVTSLSDTDSSMSQAASSSSQISSPTLPQVVPVAKVNGT